MHPHVSAASVVASVIGCLRASCQSQLWEKIDACVVKFKWTEISGLAWAATEVSVVNVALENTCTHARTAVNISNLPPTIYLEFSV